jgi:hypothetical protein
MSAEFDTRSHVAYHENFITWSTQLPCQEKRSMFELHTHNCDFASCFTFSPCYFRIDFFLSVLRFSTSLARRHLE